MDDVESIASETRLLVVANQYSINQVDIGISSHFICRTHAEHSPAPLSTVVISATGITTIKLIKTITYNR